MSGCYTGTNSNKIRIAEVDLADETGTIRLRLINDQCECAHENATLVIRNGLVMPSGNYLRIEIERSGSVKVSTVKKI
ncbi:hypothetical protein SteCoe_8234 [Stentor coeruleus]|uniref:Single-stranded DNA binding protein Ssb-like OB fold domain-containing protein n=1 Tax=Stentor coeruleus TaxID=5963 RepID=A0A1R2CKT1_9CILI|nr:hypothetical protein SteCoe_8234 [Stentor coeruleus]